jgi:integrase
MKIDNYDDSEGYQISLSDNERERVLNNLCCTSDEHAWILASWSGLRRGEIGAVRFQDMYQRESGDWFVRVYESNAKRDQFRETAIPERFAYKIQATQDANDDLDISDKVVYEHTMKTVSRHLKATVEELAEETGEEMYKHIRLHDGRRTFANQMLDDNVPALQVMEWGGWSDWQVFRDHYLKDFSTEYQSEQLKKTDY